MVGVFSVLMSIPLFFSLDPDFGWHIYLGKWMVGHHQLIHTLVGYNYFSGYSLIDHQWLADILLYPLYQHLGYLGFIFLAAVVLFITIALIYKVTRLRANSLASLCACSLFLVSYGLSYGVRLQIFLFLGAALLWYVSCFVSKLNTRLFWYAFILIIGNNLHGGFVILALLPLCFELSMVVQHKMSYQSFFWVVIIVAAAIFINPNGFAYWHLVHDYLADGYYQQHIDEWLHPFSPPYWSALLPMTIATSLLLSLPIWRKSWPEVLLIGIFGYLGLAHLRFSPLWLLLVTPYLGEMLSEVERNAGTLKKLWRSIEMIGLALAMVFYLIIDGMVVVQAHTSTPNTVDPLISYLDSHECHQGILLNDYNLGGYLLLKSHQPVFIDGRGPQLPLGNGKTLLEAYDQLLESPSNKLLAHYGITQILLQKTTLNSLGNPLSSFLAHDPQWYEVQPAGDVVLYQSTTCLPKSA